MYLKKKIRAISVLALFLMLSCTQQPSKNLTKAQNDQKVQGAFAWLAPLVGMIALSSCGKNSSSGGLSVPSSLTSLPEITSSVGSSGSSISLHEDRNFTNFGGPTPPAGSPPPPPSNHGSLPPVGANGQGMQGLGAPNPNQSRAFCEVSRTAADVFGVAASADQMLCMTQNLADAINLPTDGSTQYLSFTVPSKAAPTANGNGKVDPNAPGGSNGPSSMKFRMLELKNSAGAITHFQVTQYLPNGNIHYLDQQISATDGSVTITAVAQDGSSSSFEKQGRLVVTGHIGADGSWADKTIIGYEEFTSPIQTNTETITLTQLANLITLVGWRNGTFTVNGSPQSNSQQIDAEMAFSGTDPSNYEFGYGSANYELTGPGGSMTGVASWDSTGAKVVPASGGQLYSAVSSATLPTISVSAVQSEVTFAATETWDGTAPSGSSFQTIDPGKAFAKGSHQDGFAKCGSKFYVPPPSDQPCNQN